jgi:hypothetical protein
VCKSDPNPIRSDFGTKIYISDRIDKVVSQSDRTSIFEIKWINYPRIIAKINYPCISRLSLHFSFDTSIGRHFVSFLTCISCFYIDLVKHFNLNEKFILLKNSSDRIGLEYFITTRIGFGLDKFGSDRILNISQVSDYKRPIRSDAHLYEIQYFARDNDSLLLYSISIFF